MCGRYTLTASIEELAHRFDFDPGPEGFRSRYNVAPTQQVLTIVGGTPRKAAFMRWGLVPRWAKSSSQSRPIINARAETVAEKPTFRHSFRQRRCLVLADGFYEWQKTGTTKRPMRVVMRSGEPFAFAGIWSTSDGPDGDPVSSCAIITTTANGVLEPIHHRMPVILPEELEALWLDTALDDPATLTQLLEPYPDDNLEAYEVSRLVNSASNDVPEVTAPLHEGKTT